MSEIQSLDGILSGQISSISSITSNLSTVHNIQYSLDKQNPESEVQLLKTDGELTGEIVSTYEITSEITSALAIQGQVSTMPLLHNYEGTYEISPVAELDIILETSNKILKNDIVVKEIPYFETSNESGGYTVIIG